MENKKVTPEGAFKFCAGVLVAGLAASTVTLGFSNYISTKLHNQELDRQKEYLEQVADLYEAKLKLEETKKEVEVEKHKAINEINEKQFQSQLEDNKKQFDLWADEKENEFKEILRNKDRSQRELNFNHKAEVLALEQQKQGLQSNISDLLADNARKDKLISQIREENVLSKNFRDWMIERHGDIFNYLEEIKNNLTYNQTALDDIDGKITKDEKLDQIWSALMELCEDKLKAIRQGTTHTITVTPLS